MSPETQKVLELVAMAVGSGVSGALVQNRALRRQLLKVRKQLRSLNAEFKAFRHTTRSRIALLEAAHRGASPAAPRK
ncbi:MULTISPECIES: hypothetical protein [unclassified Corallococcus]|uniref:hypothetical protein n=1 Tax=unclassified Corallococcus TaxID=2685029 RepID=UPI001A8DB182|nr:MULTISPECIES: hypothetical protein [unclassified Corallococcus]MBN9685397.1 hypothetical protein [Corallococcus sp. NCSPR001]WAS83152.1 hypothetical protein O0N60_28005 [Corallococcus sp. NCRR]